MHKRFTQGHSLPESAASKSQACDLLMSAITTMPPSHIQIQAINSTEVLCSPSSSGESNPHDVQNKYDGIFS